MSVSKIVTSAALALSLVAVPTIAAAAPAASKLSITAPAARTGATVTKARKGGGSSIIIAVLAAAAVIAGIVIAADGNDKPTSALSVFQEVGKGRRYSFPFFFVNEIRAGILLGASPPVMKAWDERKIGCDDGSMDFLLLSI